MPREPLPSPLLTARSLENGMPAYRQSRESIFVKQGKLLAGYEDDYVESRDNCKVYVDGFDSEMAVRRHLEDLTDCHIIN